MFAHEGLYRLERATNYTYLEVEALAADAQQPIEVRAGNTLAGAIAIQQFVEPQLHHLVVLALEAVHATEIIIFYFKGLFFFFGAGDKLMIIVRAIINCYYYHKSSIGHHHAQP